MGKATKVTMLARGAGLRLLARNTLAVDGRAMSSAVLDPFRSSDGRLPPESNITPALESKIGKGLHMLPNHPLGMIKDKIVTHLNAEHGGVFQVVDSLPPVVTTKANFDDLLTPADHVSRSRHDTYYVNDTTVLRCHTSAHQTELLKSGAKAFLCTGDVFRRDTIDATHSPVFHQMEGVRIWPKSEGVAVVDDLQEVLEGLARHLFDGAEVRWDYAATFPFTDPSIELEVNFEGEWLEVLGCGKIQSKILDGCGLQDMEGWAFGLGLERLAMVLYGIPDIRLFWSEDERFRKQFAAGKNTKFVPFSKYPPVNKDIAFWVPEEFHENGFYEVVRSTGGSLVENVEEIDNFIHPKTGRQSRCFRIMYRSLERTLTNTEIDELQVQIREAAAGELGVELR